MRIRTRLRLNTWIILGVMSLMLLSLVWSFWDLTNADRNEYLVAEIQKAAYERVALRDEYLLRREERARIQWNVRTEQFRKLLEDARGRFTGIHDKTILEGVQNNFNETVALFSQLADYRTNARVARDENSVFSTKEQQLLSYIIVNAYDLMNSIRNLRESTSRASDAAHQRSTILVVFFMCLIVIITIGNSVVINRILTKRIAELIEGTETIGAGNLDHRIPVTANDELAELAKASNAMSVKLQASYTSLENLHREINERRLTEEELRESRNEMQWLLKSMINAFVLFESIFDEHGHFVSHRFVYINDAYEHITGVINEEVRGKTVHEVWPQTEPEWIRRYGEVAVTGVSQMFDLYHDPTRKFYHCNAYRPWETKDRFCVIFEDITEYKQAGEALKESESRYRTIFENATEGIFLSTPEGKYLTANPSLARMFGYVSPEAMIAGVTDIAQQLYVNPDDRRRFKEEIEKRGSVEGFEIEEYRKDGDRIWVSVNAHTVKDKSGQALHYEGMVQDITARKRAEEEIRKMTRELEERVKERTAELEQKIAEIERLNRIFVGRELRMAELKRQLKDRAEEGG
jgi:PAS domain S-box-containing protein